MPRYVWLIKLTKKGLEEIKDSSKRVEAAEKEIEGLGGKLLDFYMVMGEYDYVAIVEFPSDEVYMTYVLGLGAAGFVRTTSLKAFSREEFDGFLSKLP